MELKKESIQMLRIKNKAAAQATFDEDYNVPDVRFALCGGKRGQDLQPFCEASAG